MLTGFFKYLAEIENGKFDIYTSVGLELLA